MSSTAIYLSEIGTDILTSHPVMSQRSTFCQYSCLFGDVNTTFICHNGGHFVRCWHQGA